MADPLIKPMEECSELAKTAFNSWLTVPKTLVDEMKLTGSILSSAQSGISLAKADKIDKEIQRLGKEYESIADMANEAKRLASCLRGSNAALTEAATFQ